MANALKSRGSFLSVEDQVALVQRHAQGIFDNYPVTVTAYPALDHDGDETIKTVVTFDLMDRVFDFRELIPLEGRLRDAAWNDGLRSFVQIKHIFHPDQVFAKVR